MRFPPLTEGSSINLNNSRFNKSLSTNKFIVRSVINDINDTGLASDSFRTPRKVTEIKTKSTEFLVTSAYSYFMNSLNTKFGVGGLTT